MKRIEEIKTKRQNQFITNRFVLIRTSLCKSIVDVYDGQKYLHLLLLLLLLLRTCHAISDNIGDHVWCQSSPSSEAPMSCVGLTLSCQTIQILYFILWHSSPFFLLSIQSPANFPDDAFWWHDPRKQVAVDGFFSSLFIVGLLLLLLILPCYFSFQSMHFHPFPFICWVKNTYKHDWNNVVNRQHIQGSQGALTVALIKKLKHGI